MVDATAPAIPALHDEPRWPWSPAGFQFLPVSGFIPYRFLVTYRAPAAALAPLVPRGLTLDTHAGAGFLSVCALEVKSMGIAGAPGFLRFDNREFLYRLGVRLEGRPTFVTLRSDVSSRALSLLGRYFSHYRPELARFAALAQGDFRRLECVSADGGADGVLEAETAAGVRPEGSVFASAGAAADFLLGMDFSAEVRASGRVQVQRIEHSPWNAVFARVHAARFRYVEELGRRLNAPLVYDHTLIMQGISQTWRAASWS